MPRMPRLLPTRPPEPREFSKAGFVMQRQWSWLIAFAFFFGEVGAGLFMLSALVRFDLGMLVGWIAVVVLKNYTHMIYLGHPLRFWRAVARPQTSWLSRGTIAVGAFMIFGLWHMVIQAGWLGWGGTTAGQAIMVLALAAAFVVAIYDGLLMAYSPAIPLWNTPLLPMLCLAYSLLAGTTGVYVMGAWGGWELAVELDVLERIEIGLIVANLVIVFAYIYTMANSERAARESANLIAVTRYRLPFYVGVVGIGLVLTLALSILYAQLGVTGLLAGIAIAELVGDFLVRFVLLRAGTYRFLATSAVQAFRVSR